MRRRWLLVVLVLLAGCGSDGADEAVTDATTAVTDVPTTTTGPARS